MADKVDKALPMREGEQALIDTTNALIDEVGALPAASSVTNNVAPVKVGNPPNAGDGKNKTAVGDNSSASASGTVAIGTYANAAYISSVALGHASVASESYQVSVGQADNLRKISFVKTPTASTDAATKGYVDAYQGTPANGTVTAAKIADSAVTTAKLAASAVTTDKVADKTINESKLTDALSVKLNQRKEIECFVVPSQTVAAGKYVDYTYTYNYTYSKNPVVLPIIYGSVMPTVVSISVAAVSTTSCTVRLTNNSTSSQTVTSCYVAVISRG